jgi:hypothetical protein
MNFSNRQDKKRNFREEIKQTHAFYKEGYYTEEERDKIITQLNREWGCRNYMSALEGEITMRAISSHHNIKYSEQPIKWFDPISGELKTDNRYTSNKAHKIFNKKESRIVEKLNKRNKP